MIKIKVFIHSYKNKNLLDFCENLQKNAFHEVAIDVYDQNTIDRSEAFYNKKNINYKHILWDDRKGISYYRMLSLHGRFDYFLSISDLTIFKSGWDLELIKECTDMNIVSGKNLISLKIDNFFILQESEISEKVSESQWINKDFIFLKMSNAVLLSKSKFLKKYGESLFFSILFSELNFKIKSMYNSFYDKEIEEEKYLPYSKYHGYNKLISMIKNKEIKYKKFEEYHKLDLLKLNLLPFETDDVSYYKPIFNIDFEEETRFHRNIKKIEIV
jgi:hypothetical protein